MADQPNTTRKRVALLPLATRINSIPAEPARNVVGYGPYPDVPVTAGWAGHKAAHAALLSLSNGMPDIPDKFDPDTSYRVRLKHVVQMPNDPSHALRPSSDVVLAGAFAETIRDSIASASPLPAPDTPDDAPPTEAALGGSKDTTS